MRYLLVGHVLKDLINNGESWKLGGTAAYSAVVSRMLGNHTQIVTSIGQDIYDEVYALTTKHDIKLELVPSKVTTTFINTYNDGARVQKCLDVASRMGGSDIPEHWLEHADVVHIAPMMQEFNPSILAAFPYQMVGVTVQGWLRGRTPDHNVVVKTAERLHAWLNFAKVLILSLEDCGGDEDLLLSLINSVDISVVTKGPLGCTVYANAWGEPRDIPTMKVQEVDPTGAGDVFAAAYFTHFEKYRHPYEAADYANHIASQSVTASGVDHLEEVIKLYEQANIAT